MFTLLLICAVTRKNNATNVNLTAINFYDFLACL